jgi:hypothetical protein
VKARAALAAACLILIGCSEDKTSKPLPNHVPRVDSLRIAPAVIMRADTVLVRVYASDADGDSLHYAFAATDGDLLETSGGAFTWLAPDTSVACTLWVEVTDGRATAAADTAVLVHDEAPLTLTFGDILAISGEDTTWASGTAEPDTFPLGSTFRARWTVASVAAVHRIRYEWRGTVGELPGGARSFEAAVDFSGPAMLALQAIGSYGQSGPRISYRFTGNFDPRTSFLRDEQGRRMFQANGEVRADGDTLPRLAGGYLIATCVTARDPDGRIIGHQYLFDPRGGSNWSPATHDTCFEVSQVSDGDYAIFARSIDDAQRTGPRDGVQFFVNQAPRFMPADPPSGFVQNPVSGDTLSRADANPLEIRFWARDPDGELQIYRYKLDSHPWSLPITPSPGPVPGLPAASLLAELPYQIGAGSHRITVIALDEGGRQTAIDVTFVVLR